MKTSGNSSRIGRRGIRRRGFTLAELLVVIGVIALSLSIIVPSLHGIFTARSDREAEATMGGMLSLARGLAIENQSYALLHVQMGVDGECWAAVFTYDFETSRFVPAPGCRPLQLPKGNAFGEVSDAVRTESGGGYSYVSGSDYTASLNSDAGWAGFTTFNVIFNPDGSLVTEVNGAAPVFDTAKEIFTGLGKDKIWDPSAATLSETGVRAMTVFDYKTAKLKSDRAGYLNSVGRFLCVNPYTGQLIKFE